MNNLPVDISQTEITPGIAIGQSLVVESQQVKQGGVKVVHVDLVLDRLVAELVGCAIGEAGLDATTSQPGREPIGIVIATGNFLFVGILNVGGSAKFTAPPDDGVLQQPPLLQVLQKPSDRFVDRLCPRFVLRQFRMLIKIVSPTSGAGGDLNKANAVFAEAAGHQALAPEIVRLLLTDSIHRQRPRSLFA